MVRIQMIKSWLIMRAVSTNRDSTEAEIYSFEGIGNAGREIGSGNAARVRKECIELVFNISRSGAAIRFHGIHAPLPGPWPARLKHGDEIWISGLLEVAVPCWVVDVREGVLRVHFSLDPAMLRELRAKITTLIRP